MYSQKGIRELYSVETNIVLNDAYSYFSVIMPEGSINFVNNPEFANLNGYATEGMPNSIVELTTEDQQYGINSLRIQFNDTYEVNPVDNYFYLANINNVPNPDGMTFSLSIKGEAELVIFIFNPLAPLENSEVKRIKTTNFWNRYHVSTGSSIAGALSTRLCVASLTEQAIVYIDGFQFENKPYPTTFISGNLESAVLSESTTPYFWFGTPNNSPSARSPQTHSGGREVGFHEFGFDVNGFEGLGIPEFTHNFSALALRDGALYQNSSISSRDFSILGLITANSKRRLADLRGFLERSVSPNRTATPQPVRISYQLYDCDTPVCQKGFIDAFYRGGLNDVINNNYNQEISIDMLMLDPFVNSTGNKAFIIDEDDLVFYPSGVIGQTPAGQWQFMDPVVQPGVLKLAQDGFLYLGKLGSFTPGQTLSMLQRWDGLQWVDILEVRDNGCGPVPAGGGGNIFDIVPYGDSDLYVVGRFRGISNMSGTSCISATGTRFLNIAKYNIVTDTLTKIAELDTPPTNWRINKGRVLHDGRILFVGLIGNVYNAAGVLQGNFNNTLVVNPLAGDSLNVLNPAILVNPGVGDETVFDRGEAIEQHPVTRDIYIGGRLSGDTRPDVDNVIKFNWSTQQFESILAGNDVPSAGRFLLNGDPTLAVVFALQLDKNNRLYIGGVFDSNGTEPFANYPSAQGGVYYDETIANTALSTITAAKTSLARCRPSEPQNNFSGTLPEALGLFYLGIPFAPCPPTNPFTHIANGIIYNMKMDSKGNIHIVGDFGYVSKTWVNNLFLLTPPIDAIKHKAWEAATLQNYEAIGYVVFDGVNFASGNPAFGGCRASFNAALEIGSVNQVSSFNNTGFNFDFNQAVLNTIPPNAQDTVFYFNTQSLVNAQKFFNIGCTEVVRPKIVLSGPLRVFRIVNFTTQKTININKTLLPNEILTIDLSGILYTAISNLSGNQRDIIAANSNLGTFSLVPGENLIGIFLDANAVELTNTSFIAFIFKEKFLSVNSLCCEEFNDIGYTNTNA